MVVGTPGDALDCGAVGCELADGSGAFGAPNEELVVVASRSQQIVVKGPLQAAYLLRVALVLGHNPIEPLTDVPHLDTSVP